MIEGIVKVISDNDLTIKVIADQSLTSIVKISEGDTEVVKVLVPQPLNTVKLLIPGKDGAQGPAGAGATIVEYTLLNVTSFTAVHPFAYQPRVTVSLPTGEEVEVEYYYASASSVYLTFNAPFSGKLTLA